jgi:quercetin dioxygenase-like cupin family protein
MIGRHLAFVVLASVATLVAQASTPFGEDTWHHVVYENPTMRLFSVNVAPGMMTGMHEHQFDIVTVSMNEGTPTRVQTPGQKQAEDRAPRALGNAAATDYTGKPAAHRIENVGTRAYQLFAVENRKKGGWSTGAAVTGIGTKMIQETRAFRIYETNLALNTSQSSHTHTSPTVAILISGKAMSDGPDTQAKAFAPAPVGLRQMDQPGQWIVIPAGDRHHLVRLGTTDARVVEVEVR